MQGKAAVCVLLLTLVSYKTLGTGARDKRNVWVWEKQIFFSLLFFLCLFFLFLLFFPPQTWLAAKNWSKNEEQGFFIWALIWDSTCQCVDDVLAQKRNLKSAEILLIQWWHCICLKLNICLNIPCSQDLTFIVKAGQLFLCISWFLFSQARKLSLEHLISLC